MSLFKKILVPVFILLIPAIASFAKDYSAGPIWSNDDAKGKCPNVCTALKLEWNGNWVTTIWGKESVCNCVAPFKEEEKSPDIVPAPEPAPEPVKPAPVATPAAPTEEHKGNPDTCTDTCKRERGADFTGERVYRKLWKRFVCRCNKT